MKKSPALSVDRCCKLIMQASCVSASQLAVHLLSKKSQSARGPLLPTILAQVSILQTIY